MSAICVALDLTFHDNPLSAMVHRGYFVNNFILTHIFFALLTCMPANVAAQLCNAEISFVFETSELVGWQNFNK